MTNHCASQRQPRPRRQRGIGLIEGLISLGILSFGVLGLARFQIGILKQTTDSQNRATAAALSKQLLAYVRIDTTNAACYTLPQVGACGSTVAQKLAQDWAADASAAGLSAATATMPSATQFKATLSWNSKAFAGDTRTHEVTTDVRP